MLLDSLIDRLERVRPSGKGYTARCPAHEDKRPSLSVNPGTKGILVYCNAGCSTPDVVAALGLRMTDLFYDAPANQTNSIAQGVNLDRQFNRMVARERLGLPEGVILERFDQVAWFSFPRDPVRSTQSHANNAALSYRPFNEAIRYWVVLRDGWLWDWLGERWLLEGSYKLDWWQFRDWMYRKMLYTYRIGGPS